MKLIVDLLRWLWPRRQPASEGSVLSVAEGADRTSMADFVRILRMHDEETSRRNYPN